MLRKLAEGQRGSLGATVSRGGAPIAPHAGVSTYDGDGWKMCLRGVAVSLGGDATPRLPGTGTLTDATAAGCWPAVSLPARGADHVLGEHA